MLGNSLGILYSALLADQKSLEVRNRNVVNVNNPDYVREEPLLSTLPAFGGVEVKDVARLSDEILRDQLLDANARLQGYEEEYNLLSEIQTYFDENLGQNVGYFIDKFYDSLLNFLRDPANEGAKEETLQYGRTLAGLLKDRYNQLSRIGGAALQKINLSVARVNTLTRELAKLNKEILFTYSKTKGSSEDYKYLLDRRDKILKELSQYGTLQINTDDIGRVEVSFIQNDSTAAGLIKLVSYEGTAGRISFDTVDKVFVDQNGTEWPLEFFKNGLFGAYASVYQKTEELKQMLDNVAAALVNNTTLENGNKAVFNGTSVADLELAITKTDLDNYDTTQSEVDQTNVSNAWNGVAGSYKDFLSKLSSALTDAQIRYETENDLYTSLQTKYSEKVGVNLDEELAEIMKLQQHYQAVSKMIATSTRMLDYILNAVG